MCHVAAQVIHCMGCHHDGSPTTRLTKASCQYLESGYLPSGTPCTALASAFWKRTGAPNCADLFISTCRCAVLQCGLQVYRRPQLCCQAELTLSWQMGHRPVSVAKAADAFVHKRNIHSMQQEVPWRVHQFSESSSAKVPALNIMGPSAGHATGYPSDCCLV